MLNDKIKTNLKIGDVVYYPYISYDSPKSISVITAIDTKITMKGITYENHRVCATRTIPLIRYYQKTINGIKHITELDKGLFSNEFILEK